MSFIIFREMSREDDDTFHLMFAKIKRKDIKRFEEEVLPELHKKLLIEYGNKYTKMCQMLEKIKQDAHKMRENRDKGLDNNDKDI